MAGAVATPPKKGSSTTGALKVGSSKNSFEEDYRNMFFLVDGDDADSKTIPDNADLDDTLFQPFSFDFEDVWDRVSAELKEYDEDDMAEVRTELLAAHKEFPIGGGPMNFRLPDDDIFGGIFDKDIFPIPPLDNLKELVVGSSTMSHGQSRRGGNAAELVDVEPSFKKHKADTKKVNREVAAAARKTSDSDTQFVFVQEISTSQKKVLSLRRGERVPPGYELTTIKGDVPPLPDDLASFPADALQEAILGAAITTSKSAALSPIQSSSGLSTIKRRSSEKKTSPPRGLTSLEDYMKAEKEKEKPKLVYKKRSPNSQKVVSIINKTAAEDNNGIGIDDIGMDIDIVPVRSNEESTVVRISYPPAKSKQTPNNRSSTTDIVSSIEPLASPSLPAPSNPSPQEPTKMESTTTISTVKNESTVFYGCKTCGETFPVCDDNRFRKHMLISHDVEFMEDDISPFEESKLMPTDFRRCKRCNFLLINKFEEHQVRCLPFANVESAFEICDKPPGDSLYKLECGLCPNRYSGRYELKQHIEQDHKQVCRKIILDPEFRCASCLSRFDSSVALIRHCAICTVKRPKQVTLLELAKSAQFCDICVKRHTSIEETLLCYFNKSYRRCIFCMAIFKSKNVFYRHLYKYHSLQMCSVSNKFKIACPVCIDNTSEKISQIAQHMVKQHLSQMLCVGNQSLPMPLPIQQKQQQAVSTVSKKPPVPGLYNFTPVTSTHINSNTPQGCVFNSRRISPTVIQNHVAPQLAIVAGRQIERRKGIIRAPVGLPNGGGHLVSLNSPTLQQNPKMSINILKIPRTVGTMSNFTPAANSSPNSTRQPFGSFAVGLGPTGLGMMSSVVRTSVASTNNASSQPARSSVSPPTPQIVSVTSTAQNGATYGTGISTSSVQNTQTRPNLLQVDRGRFVLGRPITMAATEGYTGQIGVGTPRGTSQLGHRTIRLIKAPASTNARPGATPP